MRSIRRVPVLLVLGLLLASGCEHIVGQFSFVRGLMKEFPSSGVSIDVSGKTMDVTLTNHFREEPTAEERAAAARRVAEYVRDHYPGYGSLTTVKVGFDGGEAKGFVRAEWPEGTYTFTAADLGPPHRKAEAGE